MMDKDSGGPAFACAAPGFIQGGMRLRDYLIAHAPPVPDCYQPDPTPPMDWLAERELSMDEQTDRRRAEERRALERVLSWPGFWADEQIERRGT